MSPLIFINGVVFASAGAVTLGLAVTLLIVLLLGSESPVLAAETEPLLEAVALFAVMTVASALSFLGVLKQKTWRWAGVALMLACLALLIGYFWPD